MECADTDICLQRIVTILEQKDTLYIYLVLVVVLNSLILLLLIIFTINGICSVTSGRGRAWFVNNNVNADVAVLIEDEEE